MKPIMHEETGSIKRRKDSVAAKWVKLKGWKYCPKSKWKEMLIKKTEKKQWKQ